MRKIAVILPSLDEKGPFIVAKNIISPLLKSDKYNVCLITLRGEQVSYEGLPVFSLKMNKFPRLSTIAELKVLIEKENVDLIHAHTFWPTVLASYIKVNKVVTVHNNPFEDYSYEYGKFLGGFMAYIFTKRANLFDKVVSISKFVQSSVSNFGSLEEDKHLTIYNGINVDAMGGLKKKDLSNHISFIMVAALISRKNISEAIELMVLLKSRGITASLSIVGEGPLFNNLKEQTIQYDLAEEVIFLGSQSYSKTMSLIQDADVFLFTSKSEGFGLVLVEAMLNGTVVLARKIPTTEEVLENDRLIFESHDEFTSKLDYIVENYSLIQKESLERAQTNFSFNLMSQRYLNVYDSIFER